MVEVQQYKGGDDDLSDVPEVEADLAAHVIEARGVDLAVERPPMQ